MPSTMITASLQAAAISSASNVLAQLTKAYQDKIPFTFDVNEFLRFVIISFVTAPINYKWQQLLERTFPAYAPDQSSATVLPLHDGDEKRDRVEPAQEPRKLNIKHTLMKWFIDCMTIGALFNTVMFLVLIGVLKGQARETVAKNIRTETIPIILNSYKVWPIASIISFSCIPAEKRIVFLSCVGLLWGIYMSLIAANL